MKKFIIACPFLSDNQGCSALIKKTIEELGHKVLFGPIKDGAAYNGELDYDIIILEPEMSDWEWLDVLLRSRRQNPHVPVVLFSLGITEENFSPLPDDPSVFLFNNTNMLKKNFDQILRILKMSEKRILFVDDDINILKAFERSLRKTPWQIFTIPNAQKALETLESEKMDLVVTDIKMPGMHGFELIAKIRSKNKKLPVIVCSGYNAMKKYSDMHFYDVAAFIEKPVNIKILEKEIRAVVG